ncbi:MAG: hypothetical protein IPJ54_21165 [Saprospiraceae bacterium]|nr:hypothetical protein [Saprospiraceae bacterium]
MPNSFFEGLDVQRLYTFSFFASRMQAMDSRQTAYRLIGATEINLYLEVSNNEGEWVTANLRPSPDGTIKVRVQKGPANNNFNGFITWVPCASAIKEMPMITPR